MGQLDEFASDIDGVIADLEAQAAVLNERKNALKARGSDVLGRWHEHLQAKDAALTRAENAINKLSNVPLSGPSTIEGGGSELPFRPPGTGNGAAHE